MLETLPGVYQVGAGPDLVPDTLAAAWSADRACRHVFHSAVGALAFEVGFAPCSRGGRPLAALLIRGCLSRDLWAPSLSAAGDRRFMAAASAVAAACPSFKDVGKRSAADVRASLDRVRARTVRFPFRRATAIGYLSALHVDFISLR